jgi:perosamine synthetase
MSLRIPLAKPEITDEDRQAVLDVLHTPHLSMGPKVQEFERAICDYTGTSHAVAVNSGTSALHIAVRALGLEPGAEVILPSFTFSALLNVILQEGLRPRFVDIDPATYNTTSDAIAAAITSQTRLILAVHTFGLPVDSQTLREIAEKHHLHLIEDACEALGTEIHGHRAGSFGKAGLFAFYPNKQITTGEGGMLITSDEQLASQARRLRNQGRDSALDWYQHAEVGFSYRLSEINCALGVSQLARIDAVIERRHKLAEIYDRELAQVAELIRPPLTSDVGRISWFVYPVQLAPEFNTIHRNKVCELLLHKGIAAGRYFAPLHRQPVLKQYGYFPALPQTELVADRVIALPFFNALTAHEIQEVRGALEESMSELRRKI